MKIKLNAVLNEFELCIDTEIADSGICVIFGRSGSGKTSLINLIAGLETPISGVISHGDQCFYDSDKNINLPTHQRDIGYVFQQARLFPHLDVNANLRYGYNETADANQVLLKRVIDLLQIDALLKRFPSSLSGGEQQRVAIGRALLKRPKLLLMDEPLSSLDHPRKKELLTYLEQLNKTFKLPILYVTHSLDEVLYLADEMLVLDQGKLLLQGDVESVWNHPKMKPWLGHDQQCALLHTKVSAQHPKHPLTALDLGDGQQLWVTTINSEFGAPVRLRIYAKDISLTAEKATRTQTSIRNIIKACIVDIDIQQTNVSIKLALGSNFLWADITLWALEDLQLSVGQHIYAQIKGVSIKNQDWVTN
ncbi:MAG: molybdenum ABC transporter ATP-binding protein ModC [Oceanospirillaceae bacterium]|nr:molybdenum ABC transporter ATP-binding protein ModC [Oceanospirillaceae bacterium]